MGGCLGYSLNVIMLNYRSLRGTYYYHLNIKEMDHIVFNKKRYVMLHETVSQKLLVFTLYVNPYMSKGVSHLTLLDEPITTFVVLFLVFSLFIQISSEQQRRAWFDATLEMWSLIWICNVCQRPTKWRQGVNLFCLFCCFTSQVNSYGHCGTVSSPNHTFSWAGLNKRITSNSCTYFRL